MTRTSLGPNRMKVPVPPAPDYSLAVVTHYTDEAWHASRMEVVRLCLDTMLVGAKDKSYELLIWDNGSTLDFRAMLRGYNPAVYIESVNVGPHVARYNLNRIARGKIICHTDDDILFSPTWLDQQTEVLTTYPNVAIVAGSPMNYAFCGGIEPAVEFSKQPGVKRWQGHIIPQAWEDDFARSIGMKVTSNTRRYTETLMEYKGVKAWCHGHHMQMLCYRDVIEKFLEPKGKYLLDLDNFNVRIGSAGMLQLTTYQRTARHIGNVVDKEMITSPWPEVKIKP